MIILVHSFSYSHLLFIFSHFCIVLLLSFSYSAYAFVLPADFTLNCCARPKRKKGAPTTYCSSETTKCCRPCADKRGKIHLTKYDCRRRKVQPESPTTCCSDSTVKRCRVCTTNRKGICNLSGRDACYNSFYYTHQLLWTVFLGCFLAHGTGAWLEPSLTWVWIVLPLTIYCFERCWKTTNPHRHTIIEDAEILNDGHVVMLVIKRTPLLRDFSAGMYVQILVPSISKYEWHPFTISSGPSWNQVRHDFLFIDEWRGC